MINLRRMRGEPFVLNADLIETVEATPDTIITLTTGKKLLVEEPPAQVIELVIRYRRRIHGLPGGGDTPVRTLPVARGGGGF